MQGSNTYLSFNGNCRQAVEFYKKCLGAELEIMLFSQAPCNTPPEAKDRIMHARLTKGPVTLMASDSMMSDPVQQGNNFHVVIACDSIPEAEKLFTAFSENGKVILPLQDMFWGARFGMLTDQFGINWMFSAELPKK